MAELMQLTTIAQPAREQGRVAAAMALRALSGRPAGEATTLPTRLIVRDSTRRHPPE